MRNEMQQLKQLTELLDQITDPEERDKIQDEIYLIEESMEMLDDYDYRSHQSPKSFE